MLKTPRGIGGSMIARPGMRTFNSVSSGDGFNALPAMHSRPGVFDYNPRPASSNLENPTQVPSLATQGSPNLATSIAPTNTPPTAGLAQAAPPSPQGLGMIGAGLGFGAGRKPNLQY